MRTGHIRRDEHACPDDGAASRPVTPAGGEHVTGACTDPPPHRYRIRVRGRLGETMRFAFPALQARASGGDTVLTGPLPDRAALHGVLGPRRDDTMAAMSHYSRVLKVVIDAPPALHDQELAFWQGALGQELPEIYSAEYHGAFLRGHDLMLLVQRLETGAPRVHLDIHTDDLDAEVSRLERLGAKRVQKVQTWWVMRDPAGLLFCVLPVSPGSLTDENARRWE